MLIKKATYNKLINCPKIPPEVGGILFGNDVIVDTVIFDLKRNQPIDLETNYIPNVEYLNLQISIFIKKGKDFLGMFHTHLPQWDSLSNIDIHYIKKIMKAMPAEIKWLYFPIVYPSINIRSYIARKLKEEIIIVEDKIEIV